MLVVEPEEARAGGIPGAGERRGDPCGRQAAHACPPPLPDPSWIWCTMPWTVRTTTTTRCLCSACCTPCLTTKVSAWLAGLGEEESRSLGRPLSGGGGSHSAALWPRRTWVLCSGLKPGELVAQVTGGGGARPSADRPAQRDCSRCGWLSTPRFTADLGSRPLS